MEKQKNIPQLRFPEFDGEWVKKTIGEVSTVFSGGTPMTSKKEYFEGNIPFIKSGEIHSEFTEQNISEEAIQNSSAKLVNKGDLLYALYGATSGEVAISKINGAINQAVLCIRTQLNTYFAFTYLIKSKTNIVKKYLQGGQGNLSAEIVKSFSVKCPSIPEQKKIASFFTSIDMKISQLERKKILLEQYKKGVMQKIFYQEIRFKDDNGQQFPNWEKKKFGDVYSFKNNNSYSRENLNYEKGEVKNIHYGDIHTKFKTLFDITKEVIPYINKDLPIDKICADNYCKEGDLVFADASEDLTDVGKSIELVNLNNEKVLSGLHTILARPDLSRMAIGFGGYLVKSSAVRTQIMKEAQGSKVSSISATKLSQVQLNIPIQKEQTKIARFLSAIDDKINHTQKQIEKAEVWKKGLMQQLFI